LRQQILACLEAPEYRPCKLKQLAGQLGVSAARYRQLRRTVRELEEAGLVARLGRGQYVRARAGQRAVGHLSLHARGFGFVARSGAEPDVLVQARNLAGASEGDWVEVEILARAARGQLPEGRVVAIRQRPAARLVGTVTRLGRRLGVRPDGKSSAALVELVEPPPPAAGAGVKVAVLVTALTPAGLPAAGRVTEVLGEPADPATDRRAVVAAHQLRTEFPGPALAEAEACGDDVEAVAGARVDLRSVPILTIDPRAARDFDDAVSLEFTDSGHCRLGVHIADVDHYVRAGSALDREARERGTSVYLVDEVLPMLPERLSSHLCSLAPGLDRLTLSVQATIDGGGRVLESQLCESVIRSRARLTYEQVQAALDGEGDAGQAGEWGELLRAMHALSRRLRARRLERGALDFDLPEPRVDLGPDGLPVGLGCRPRLESHQLIEEFMLVANEAVAAFAQTRSLPVLYRVHQPPDPAKLAAFADYAADLGVPVAERGAAPTPAQLQQALAAFAGRPDADLASQLLLRAMMRAEYSSRQRGHYGLAAPLYLHFTSPIRRYPDLQVHRAVKAALHRAGRGTGVVATEAGQAVDGAGEDLEWLGLWTTECERRADGAERAHVRALQLRYMLSRVGDEVDGRVTGLLPGGIFAEVGDLMVEGFCPLSALDGYYELDDRRHCLVGRSGDRYRIGTAIRLRVARVDLALQRLDLVILSRGEPGGRRSGPSKRGRQGARGAAGKTGHAGRAKRGSKARRATRSGRSGGAGNSRRSRRRRG